MCSEEIGLDVEAKRKPRDSLCTRLGPCLEKRNGKGNVRALDKSSAEYSSAQVDHLEAQGGHAKMAQRQSGKNAIQPRKLPGMQRGALSGPT